MLTKVINGYKMRSIIQVQYYIWVGEDSVSGYIGEVWTFESFYNKFRHSMLYTALQVLHDDKLAEDAVQDALMNIYKNIGNLHFENEKMARSFAVKSSEYAAINIVRQRSKNGETSILEELKDVLVDEDAQTPLDIVISNETINRIEKLIHKLDNRTVTVLIFRLRYGFAYEIIASLLSISENNVRVIYHRGCKKLRKILLKEGIVR